MEEVESQANFPRVSCILFIVCMSMCFSAWVSQIYIKWLKVFCPQSCVVHCFAFFFFLLFEVKIHTWSKETEQEEDPKDCLIALNSRTGIFLKDIYCVCVRETHTHKQVYMSVPLVCWNP